MSFGILLPAYSLAVKNVRAGLTYHLVGLACAVRRAAGGRPIHVASTAGEDVRGLWERVRGEFPAERVIELADESAALTQAAKRVLEVERRLVVHTHSTRQLQAVAELRRRYGDRVRVVYTVHSFRNASWRRIPYALVLQRLLRRSADYTIFLSCGAMAEFVGLRRVLLGGRGGHMPFAYEQPAGWDAAPTDADSVPAPLRTALAQDAFRFIYLAAFKPGKGHEWLTRGVGPALRTHRNAQIIFAGWGEEAIRARVAAIAREEHIAEQIVMPGSIGREIVPWLLSQCHAAIVPSVSETFAQCVVEPMCCGLPVVGTRRGVSHWAIMDYYTGLGIEYGDGPGAARAVAYLAANPQAAAQMGRNAAAVARSVFDWDRVGEAHVRLYESLW